MLHHLAAIKLVRELELETASLQFQGLKYAELSNQMEKLKQEIIEISVENGFKKKILLKLLNFKTS